ncbi:hypothetical protein DFP92_106221 [Yoonia sediminilitoris]|uniref:Uncharacterized protein n=1 Tax=Yoonia sediminilitoris TaxID=1286148 RepID=A0A2T6KG83_9RHOB|nr:hypothetical protein C8N45_106221 [Yoonia sediminilitoris]RCW95277.1 hypothetical protein DFP92_106221 [Yoonia sediminilitoris]
MLFRALRNLWSKPLYPSEDCGEIHLDATLSKKTNHILISKREATIPTHRQKNNISKETMGFEWISTCHHTP